jgi:alkylation response protein AidB-like acyl-CoA dehydrogenase
MLPDGLRADVVRSSPEEMRAAVRRLADEVHEVWVGPFEDMAHALSEVARVDLALARLVEGHVDALRILDQAGATPRPGVYGVWASRSAGTGVRATADPGADGEGWRLTGESRFSSGIDVVDRVLVPGWVDDEVHLLLDVDATEVEPDRSSWHTSAMDASRSFTVRFDLRVGEGDVVGPPGFYLDRPGFPIGGLEVAAVWLGGAESVLEQVVDGLRRFRASSHQTRRLGVMEQAVRQARLVLDATAARLDRLEGDDLVRETGVARTTVAWACEQVVDEATRVVGPAGLSSNGRLARTLADLTIYVRQHHLDLTLEALGRDALRDREVVG